MPFAPLLGRASGVLPVLQLAVLAQPPVVVALPVVARQNASRRVPDQGRCAVLGWHSLAALRLPKGSAMTLLEEAEALDPVERREFSRIIVEQANHMRGLIGDLLDAGRIGAGTLTVAPAPAEVAELVEPARSAFLSGGGRHAIVVDLPAGLPRVMADPRRIVQVLGNLISNAARHAPESSPIRVAAVREQAHVAVSVSDEGPGVAPEQLPHLFRKRAGGGEGPRAGHGLGLAICKGLVEAHGGRIRADSAGPGHGTTVTFTIPAAPAPGATAPGTADAPPAGGRGPRRAAAHPRGRRRPADAALRPRRALGSRLRPDCDRCPGGTRAPHPEREAAAGPPHPTRCARSCSATLASNVQIRSGSAITHIYMRSISSNPQSTRLLGI